MLFLFGVVFCYLIVLPRGLAWLFGFNSSYFTAQARATDYFSFVAWFLVAFGAVFEMPVVIIAAVRMGIVKTKFLRKHWRYAIVINAVIAMVATPSQDAFSFIAMFIPLEILYEASLLIARVMERRRAATASGSDGRRRHRAHHRSRLMSRGTRTGPSPHEGRTTKA